MLRRAALAVAARGAVAARAAVAVTVAVFATVATVAVAGLAGAGCQDGAAASPEEAYLHLYKACDKGDPARLFDALDTPTQWSIESVQRDQRIMRRLIAETYPPDERARALARIPAAADEDEDHPRRYFRRLPRSAELLAEIGKRLHAGQGQPVGSVDERQHTATIWVAGGSIFHFARDEKLRWGFSELRDEWEHGKLRASHDVETVQKNAALYRAAAGIPPTTPAPPTKETR